MVISAVDWWTGSWRHGWHGGGNQLDINCISGVYATTTGLLFWKLQHTSALCLA